MIKYLFLTLAIGFAIDYIVRYINKKCLSSKNIVYKVILEPTNKTKKGNYLYRVVESFSIRQLVIPQNYLSDGASIPSFAWRYIGNPYDPRFIAIAIAHDYLYSQAEEVYKTNHNGAMILFKEADEWFYDALRDQNRKIIAIVFYMSVRFYSVVKFGVWHNYFKVQGE